jgi:hypothetical protein
LTPPLWSERDKRVSRDPRTEPDSPTQPGDARDTQLAQARARVAKLEVAIAKEQAVRRQMLARLEQQLEAVTAERERLDRQLHLVWVQLEHAEAKLAWAELSAWRKLLRQTPRPRG